jgi:hypothetical protein
MVKQSLLLPSDQYKTMAQIDKSKSLTSNNGFELFQPACYSFACEVKQRNAPHYTFIYTLNSFNLIEI